MEILHEKIIKYNNKINPKEWIDLIEKVSNENYELKSVERRPHMTAVIPMLFSEKDTFSSIKLKSMFYEILFPNLLSYMEKYNNFGIVSKKNFIIISKLLSGSSMEYHNDSNDPSHLIAMLYINEDYSGGEISFRDINLKYKPNSGDLLIYCGSFSHGVLEMSGNPRYSIGIGLLDPNFIDKDIIQL